MSKQKHKTSICLDCKNRSICDDPCNPSSCELKNQQEIELKIAQHIEENPFICKILGIEICQMCEQPKHEPSNECKDCPWLNLECCGDLSMCLNVIPEEDDEPLFSGDDYENEDAEVWD